ncbi:MAG: hypothetical protein JWN48_3339, partial [Myxococcaceae bacterium]|nr:hypothetical protein [Myxococcaceae bacterium]
MLACDLFPVSPPESTLPNCAYVGQDARLVLSAATRKVLKQNAGDEPVAVVVAGQLYYMNAAGRASA